MWLADDHENGIDCTQIAIYAYGKQLTTSILSKLQPSFGIQEAGFDGDMPEK
jgi:hypothetical protein